MAKIERPFELRSVFELGTPAWAEPRAWNPAWVRFLAPVEEAAGLSQPISRCLLAYASDMGLVSTGHLPHQQDINRSQLQMASLDHVDSPPVQSINGCCFTSAHLQHKVPGHGAR